MSKKKNYNLFINENNNNENNKKYNLFAYIFNRGIYYKST